MPTQPASTDLSLVSHLGAVVKDADKTADFLSSFGIGPWRSFDSEPSKDELIMGDLKPFRLHTQWTRLSGDLVIELIQPIDKESVWAQFLKTHGEGLQHIAFITSNLDEVVSRFKAQGGRVLVAGSWGVGGKRWCYIETKPKGLVVEVMDDGLHQLSFPGAGS